VHVDVRKNGGLCTETPGTTPGPALPPEPTERPILKLSFGLENVGCNSGHIISCDVFELLSRRFEVSLLST
jgi:hypothetical protein